MKIYFKDVKNDVIKEVEKYVEFKYLKKILPDAIKELEKSKFCFDIDNGIWYKNNKYDGHIHDYNHNDDFNLEVVFARDLRQQCWYMSK